MAKVLIWRLCKDWQQTFRLAQLDGRLARVQWFSAKHTLLWLNTAVLTQLMVLLLKWCRLAIRVTVVVRLSMLLKWTRCSWTNGVMGLSLTPSCSVQLRSLQEPGKLKKRLLPLLFVAVRIMLLSLANILTLRMDLRG